MAPAFKAIGTRLAPASSSAANLAVPAGVATGDIIIAFIAQEMDGPAVPVAITTVPSGFTEMTNSPTTEDFLRQHVYWKRATGADSGTYNFAFASAPTTRTGYAIAFSGCITSGNPINVETAAGHLGGNINFPDTSITTTVDNTIMVWLAQNYDSTATNSPAGWAERADDTAPGASTAVAVLAKAVAGASGTISASAASGIQNKIVWLGALLPGPDPDPPEPKLTIPVDHGMRPGPRFFLWPMQPPPLRSTEGNVDYTSLATDLVGVTDSVTVQQNWVRTQTDLVGITDTEAEGIGRSVTDPVGITDNISIVVGRTSVDSVSVTDSVTLQQLRIQTDSVGLVDDVTATAKGQEYPASPLRIPNRNVGPMALRNRFRQPVILNNQLGFTSDFTDPVGIADSVSVQQNWVRTQTDAVGVTDSTVEIVGRTKIEPVGITDSISITLSRTKIDLVGITDSAAIQQNWVRTTTDPVAITDSATAQQNWVRTQTDPVGITDSVAITVGRTKTDLVGITDSTVKIAGRINVDPVGITDTVTVQQNWVRTQTDPVGLVDDVTATTKVQEYPAPPLRIPNRYVGPMALRNKFRQPFTSNNLQNFTSSSTDSVGITDTTANTVGRNTTELVGITDTLIKSAGRSVANTVGITDSVTADIQSAGTVNATDLVGITDGVVKQQNWLRSQTNPVGITDIAAKVVGSTKTDSVGILDTTGFITNYARALSNPVGITEDRKSVV